MEYMEFKGKTKSDAIMEACTHFSVPSDRLDYEVVDEGKTGFLGMGAKPAIIKARPKEEMPNEDTNAVKLVETPDMSSVKAPSVDRVSTVAKSTAEDKVLEEEKPFAVSVDDRNVEAVARKFLADIFVAMNLKVEIKMTYDSALRTLDVDLDGEEMGVLIGKRGQTLDSLQYLISLVVNKGTGEYIRVKVDTENYRQRRKETLENLAKNIAYKVKSTRRAVSLEPMNPYERRIIHSALQNDRYVTTHSEGNEPFRRVVVTPKRDSYNDGRGGKNGRNFNRDTRGYRGNKDYKGSREENENAVTKPEEN